MAARHGLPDIGSVIAMAQRDAAWYWESAAADIGLRWIKGYEEIIDTSDGVELARFFAGGQLNWADYAVDRWVDTGHGEQLAVVWEGDDGSYRELTYSALKSQVDRAAGALLRSGVGRGDTVGVILPMIPEAVVAVLAIAKVAAIAVPMFSGYGPPAIRERLEDAGAQVVITADSFPRRGRNVPLKPRVDVALEGLPVRRVLVVERSGLPPTAWHRHDRWWHDELRTAAPFADAVSTSADDACLLLFTSGSTGRPKGCVHTHGGMPFKVAAECRHAMGIDETATLLWLTDMGWIMGSYVIAGALGNGATVALFEGTPDWPEPDRLWSVASRLGVTVLGISPTAVRSLMRHGNQWPAKHDLGSLSAIASTGEPWNLDPWMWCFSEIGRECTPIVNISGGTECGGALLAGSTLLPLKPMSFAGPALGVDADVVDNDGVPVRGEVGELVVHGPWPGMTKGLWRDRERYFTSYWRRFPGKWHQADFGYVDREGVWYLLGRSDDTITLAGKRVGPAEVESALVRDVDVVEAAAIGVPDAVKGEALVAFVVLREGIVLGPINDRLAELVKGDLGPAIEPKGIVPVAELPKTRSGKVMRRVVRALFLGLDPGDLSSLENPTSLDTLPRYGDVR